MTRKPLRIVYATDLIIRDPSLLGTLAVFYDKIYLPHPYDLDPDKREIGRWPMKYLDYLEMAQSHYKKWMDRWRPLVESSVLEVLPPAFPTMDQDPIDLQARLLDELGIKVPFFGPSDFTEGRVALAMHAWANYQIMR